MIKWILIKILLTLLLITTISCMSCNDDDEDSGDDGDSNDDDVTDDDSNDDDDDDDVTVEEVWVDSESGLMWQNNKSEYFVSALGSIGHCDFLEWADYDDWRLPSISELRTLIRGCDATKDGGSCGVTDECSNDACRDDSCDGCISYEGPGNGGWYWPEGLIGYEGFFWSSTQESTYIFWSIDFRNAEIAGVSDYDIYDDGARVRCVRNTETN